MGVPLRFPPINHKAPLYCHPKRDWGIVPPGRQYGAPMKIGGLWRLLHCKLRGILFQSKESPLTIPKKDCSPAATGAPGIGLLRATQLYPTRAECQANFRASSAVPGHSFIGQRPHGTSFSFRALSAGCSLLFVIPRPVLTLVVYLGHGFHQPNAFSVWGVSQQSVFRFPVGGGLCPAPIALDCLRVMDTSIKSVGADPCVGPGMLLGLFAGGRRGPPLQVLTGFQRHRDNPPVSLRSTAPVVVPKILSSLSLAEF